ncbi:F-box-like family protein [Aspergillus niger]|uniref:F-box-like family protein n=1 Tax=Aspergillus niger TaxID=5061 RepID=A0A505IAC7_ASPNG|nr:F-box-like family protein [Aspergillus niger]
MDLDFYWTMSIPHGVLGSFPDFSLSTPRLLTIDFSTSSSSASSYFKYLEIRLSASENTPHYAIILRDLQKAASLYSIITSNRHIYLLIVETVHMATNTMPFTCPSMVTRPRTTRPSGSYITWSDVIRSNRSPSPVIRRLRTHPSALGGTPSITKALETVRLYGGCDGLKRIIDPIEQLSLCKICTKDESLRDFLHLVCNGVIRQYRHFYYALKEHYETVDYRLGLGSSHEREQHDCTFVLYAVQIVRIIASVDRLNRILPEQPLYDEDAWYALANQGEQLVDATGRLREQVVLGDG